MNERNRLLQRIRSADFVLYEIALYLDGHPVNKRALAYYAKQRDSVMALRAEYEQKYGPLTIYGNNDDCDWHWIDHPWPWEKEAN